MYKQAQEWLSSMRILGGPCNVGSEPGPHKTGKVGMCVCVCVCVCVCLVGVIIIACARNKWHIMQAEN